MWIVRVALVVALAGCVAVPPEQDLGCRTSQQGSSCADSRSSESAPAPAPAPPVAAAEPEPPINYAVPNTPNRARR